MFMYSYCYVYGLLLLRMFCSVYSVFIVLFYLLYCVKMCTVLLPPGVNPTAVNKFIISYHIISNHISYFFIFVMKCWASSSVLLSHLFQFIFTEHPIVRTTQPLITTP